jgi:uncharacterized membrane protein (DUF106 family)
MSFLDPVLNPILQPLLNLSPFWAIVILGVIISLLIVLVYKYATNQQEMGRLKGEQKNFQKRLKELRSNPEEMMKVQKEAMKVNMEYMKHSFKATLITLLPILLIFGWMNAHLAYEPIYPGEPYIVTATFSEGVTGEVELLVDDGTELLSSAKQPLADPTWKLKSTAGTHFLTVKTSSDEAQRKVLITKDLRYEDPIFIAEHSEIKQIKINYNKLRPLGTFSIFGWNPGWLALYIFVSIVSSIILRKAFKIH